MIDTIRARYQEVSAKFWAKKDLREAEQEVLKWALAWQSQGCRSKWRAHSSVALWNAVDRYRRLRRIVRLGCK